MSDHDELSRRLRDLAVAASQRAELDTADEVRRRAGRRRTTTAVAASVASAALVLGSYTIAASIDEQRSVEPVAPPSRTATTENRPSPTESRLSPTESQTSPTESQTSPTEPTQSRPTESRPTATSTTTPGDWITTIPADVKLPHEGVASDDGDVSDWAPDPSQRSWRLLPCLEQKGYPSDSAQTDRRSILQTGPEFAYAEQLALYPDAATAATAVAEMQASLVNCAEQPGEPDRYGDTYDYYWGSRFAELSFPSRSPDDDLQSPDDAFHAWSWYRMYNSQGQETGRLGGGFFTVILEGNAIYLMMASGESDYSDSSDVDRMAKAQARLTAQFMPTLCRFSSPGGC